MGTALHNYDLRPPSRGRTPSRFDSYLDTTGLSETRENLAPPRNRSSTPSAAVRRALQVLDETKRQQSIFKNDRWSRSIDYDPSYNETMRNRRSPSPLRSRSASPLRNYSPPLWGPDRLMEIERDNFHDALDDSEARREVLLRKLADAQKTMELQNERLRDGEMDVSECKATIRLLQQVQKELEVKTQFLQKERDSSLAKSKKDAEDRETQKRKIDEVTHESTRLRCQLDLLLADKQQHHVTLQHMHKSIKDLKEQLKNKSEKYVATSKELEASKDRLKVAKQRSDLLEKEKSHAFLELEKTQKKQQTLVNRNTDLGQRMGRCQADLQDISERYDKANCELGRNKEELTMCRAKIKKQNCDLTELRRSHADLLADRDRSLKYNDEQEKTIQSMKEINKELKHAKVKCEDDLTDLHGDLARTRLELTRISDENISNKTQLVDSRKNCKKLTDEVLQLRPEVDDLYGKVQEWEGTHKVDVQKMALLEAQKSQLTCEKEDALTRLSSLHDSYEELKSHHEREMKKLNKETRELRQEKERIASQFREAQSQYTRIRDEMEANNEHTQTQLDHWRQACSKLTSLVEEKDEDLRECATQRREAEENCALAEAQKRTLEIQLGEAHTSQEEMSRLRMEQKRLSQECAENQQLISVLEMQRDILAKSPSKSTSSNDLGSKPQMQKLESELTALRVKLSQVESERNELLKRTHDAVTQSDTSEVKRVKGMNQILAEEAAKLKQEVETLQDLLNEKSRMNERDAREWKREKQHLDLRMASMVDEMNALKSQHNRRANESNSEVSTLKAEVQWLQKDLDAKKEELMVAKGEMVVMENARKRAEDRVSILEDSLEEAREAKHRQIAQSPEKQREKASADSRIKDAKLEAAEAENAVLRMQAHELENVKSSQSTLIEALKKQLEKNGGSSGDSESSAEQLSRTKELKNIRRELQRASEEILSKDKQLSEVKKKFVESQRNEQRIRQERDELQGKAIIMESLNDSSHDLLKELQEVRKEKANLEKQLNNFLTTKTSQTPPTTLALVDDLDRELEKQYRTVCERNKWLESRIASLQREIELLHDQNSLAQEQKYAAEREVARVKEELKNLQITSKGSRRQKEAEQIHLQHSNAEKMQKILDLERELSEKKQLIKAMTKEMETLQKKSEKGKISAFMKKLRRSSDSGSRDQQRLFDLSGDGDSGGAVFRGFISPSHSFDPGYSTMTMTQPVQRRANSLSPKPKSASFGGFTDANCSKSSKLSPQADPLSPTLTNVTTTDAGTDGYTSSTGDRKRSPNLGQPRPRVSFDDSSEHEHEDTGDSPSSKRDTQSPSFASSSPKHDSARGDDGAFYAEDYIDEDSRPPIIQTPKERLSKAPSPESHEPFPEELEGLPSPTSSPSLPSPSAGKLRNMPVYVVEASDESEDFDDSASDEVEEIGRNQGHYPPPMRVIPLSPQHLATVPSQCTSPPSRPRSQPTLKDLSRSPTTSQTKKKHSSLV